MSDPSGERPGPRALSKVLLVGSNQERRPYPVPPLGLCLVAERLAAAGYEVRVFDGMFRDEGALREAVSAFSPDVVGLGIRNIDDMVMFRPRVYLDDLLRHFVSPIRQSTRAPLILGGSGFSLFPRELLGLTGAELGVVGEAEHTLPALLEALAAGRDPGGLPGVVTAGGSAGAGRPGRPCAPSELQPSQLDRWIDFEPYRGRGSYPVQTKRGCTVGCLYCTYPRLEGTAVRLRSPRSIADEVEAARERLGQGVTFEFVDSTFNFPPGHAEGVCQELLRRGLGASTGLRLRAMGFTPAGLTAGLVELLLSAGFRQIDCTPDSAAPAVIRALHKGFTLEELEAAARNLRAAGLPTMWFLLFGGPGETEETFGQTLDFIDRHVDPEDMVYLGAGLRIYPGTPLHAALVEAGEVAEAEDLVSPRFHVAPGLGRERCQELIARACATRPNCVPAWETSMDEQLIRLALQRRRGDEPMFRTLLRLRRERLGGRADQGAPEGPQGSLS